MSRLRDLLDTLEAQGEVDSTGGFSLDADKARDKLRQYRLADPYWWVLLLVQSAVARGASMIEVETEGKSSLRLRFFADPLGAREVRERGSALFVSNHVQREIGALQDLAIGLDAALGLRPSAVELYSGPVTATFQYGRDDVIEGPEEISGVEGEGRLNTVTVRYGGFLGFGADQVAPALELLRTRALYSRTRISINGENVTRGLELAPGPMPVHRFYLPHTAGVMTLALWGDNGPDVGTARMRVLSNGVWLTDHEVPLPAGLDLIVDCAVLRKDVSQQDVNRDDIYEALLVDLQDEASRFAARLVEGLEALGDEKRAAAERWLRQAIPAVLPGPWTEQTGEHRSEHRTLMDAELWPTTLKGEVLSLRDIVRRQGPLYHGSAGQLVEGATVLALRGTDAERLGQAIGRELPSSSTHAARQERRARARQRFETRWHAPGLPDAPWRTRRKIESERFVGELGLHRTRDQERIAVIKEGRLLVERPLQLGIPGLVVVLEGDFAPSQGYDGVIVDDVWAQALLVVLRSVHGLLEDHVEWVLEQMERPGARPDLEHDVLVAYLILRGDREHAEKLADAQGLVREPVRSSFLERAPRPGALTPGHPLGRVPLFIDTQGVKYSIDDLRELEVPPLRGQHLEAVAPQTEVPAGSGPFLRLSGPNAGLLVDYLPERRVRFMDGSLQRERARVAFERRRPVSTLDRGLTDPWLGLARHHADAPWQGRVAVPFDHAPTGLCGVAILESRRVEEPTLAAYVAEGDAGEKPPRGRRVHDEPLPVGPAGLVVAVSGVEPTDSHDGITNLSRHSAWRAAEYAVMRLLEEIAEVAPNRFRQELGLVELLTWLHETEQTATRARSLLDRLAGDRDVTIELSALEIEDIGELEEIDAGLTKEVASSPESLALEAQLRELNPSELDGEVEEILLDQDEPTPPPLIYADQHPLTILLEAVRSQLRAARRHNGDVLAEAMLDRLGTIVSTGERPLRVDRHHVLFDGAHPMMREAVKHVDDRATVAMMTSMAFSALVRVRPDAVEVHEEVFHTAHARMLLGDT